MLRTSDQSCPGTPRLGASPGLQAELALMVKHRASQLKSPATVPTMLCSSAHGRGTCPGAGGAAGRIYSQLGTGLTPLIGDVHCQNWPAGDSASSICSGGPVPAGVREVTEHNYA